eukprot:6109652-Ditylum_brightwellii.AAC.1
MPLNTVQSTQSTRMQPPIQMRRNPLHTMRVKTPVSSDNLPPNTRVLRSHKKNLVQPSAPHVIPPEENLPPLRTPPLFITTPNGWKNVAQPHVILPEPELVATKSIMQARNMQGKYIAATNAIAANQFLANAVIDDKTGCSLEYWHLIKGKNKDV